MDPVLSITNVPSEIKKMCDREFNQQLDNTDGNVFIYPYETFQEIELTSPNNEGLQILLYFADLGCPVSAARLCVALHPDVGQSWPESCSSLSKVWFERLITALELTVYDPAFSTTYSSFVGSKLDEELLSVFNRLERHLPEQVVNLTVIAQASNGLASLFQPRGALM